MEYSSMYPLFMRHTVQWFNSKEEKVTLSSTTAQWSVSSFTRLVQWIRMSKSGALTVHKVAPNVPLYKCVHTRIVGHRPTTLNNIALQCMTQSLNDFSLSVKPKMSRNLHRHTLNWCVQRCKTSWNMVIHSNNITLWFYVQVVINIKRKCVNTFLWL